VAQIGILELVVILAIATFLFCGGKLREIVYAIEDALSNFRGGPGSPSHPIPANDSRLLNRRRVSSKNSARDI
jgi:Sec-independent protein translocase protein TatA